MQVTGKYRQFTGVQLENRTWPSKRIEKAPVWCSVDLRDGNQALVNPMGIEQKLEFFDLLVKLGFKEIEVGFPSSNDTEYDFVRRLITENRVPEDVTLQVLSQARENLIIKTLDSLKGAKKVIFHLYNATSPAQRKYNFNKSKEEIIRLAVTGVKYLKKNLYRLQDADVRLEYSPENFNQTEADYALEVCQAVMEEWGATPEKKIILNLPATVECALPNQFADQIEYFCKNIKKRDSCIISLHNHNDRGEGIAQCEMGLLAGAERVEGCLFGNGERTGNLDIVTVALNMFTQGVDPQLDFSNLNSVSADFERLTGMPVYQRSPYAGELVFTAFSGSHQDAIRKGMAARKKMPADSLWDVPYLPIDPHDVGREYEGIIRINSQSGKGGAAYILESNFGIIAPKGMHPLIGAVVKAKADRLQRELTPNEVYELFAEKWLQTKAPLNVLNVSEHHNEGERGTDSPDQVLGMATISYKGEEYSIAATGNGPLDAFVSALRQTPVPAFNVTYFNEHSIGEGSNTKAMAYVQLTMEDGRELWGAGTSSNIGRAGIAAVVSALNFSM